MTFCSENKTAYKYMTPQFSIIRETPGGSPSENDHKKLNKKIDNNSNRKKLVELRFKMESVGTTPEDDDDLEQCPAKIRSSWPNKIVPWWTSSSHNEKPPYSYATLIAHAILSSKDGRLTLSDIYQWISEYYPFYKRGEKGWQNSIRHNLSLNKKWFIKLDRRPTQAHPGKGGYWTLQPETEKVFVENLSQAGGHSRKHSDMGVYTNLYSRPSSFGFSSSDSDTSNGDSAESNHPSIHIIRPIDYEQKKNKSNASAPRMRNMAREKQSHGAFPPSTKPMKLVFRCREANNESSTLRSRSARKSVDLEKPSLKACKRRKDENDTGADFEQSILQLEPSQSKRRKSTTTIKTESEAVVSESDESSQLAVVPESQYEFDGYADTGCTNGYDMIMTQAANNLIDSFPTFCIDSPMMNGQYLDLYNADPIGYDAQFYYNPNDLLITKEFHATSVESNGGEDVVAQKLIDGLQSQVNTVESSNNCSNTIHLPTNTMSVQYHIPQGYDTSIFKNTDSNAYDPNMDTTAVTTDLEYYEISKVCDVSPTSDLIESHWQIDECFENLSEFVSLDHAGNEII